MGQGFAVVERSPSPFSGKLDINEKKWNEIAGLVSREINMSYNFYNIRRFYPYISGPLLEWQKHGIINAYESVD